MGEKPELPSWKHERRAWCPHPDCVFVKGVQDSICVGHLPEPAPHDGDFNHHRLCLNGVADNGGVFDLQINHGDISSLRRVFDALEAS